MLNYPKLEIMKIDHRASHGGTRLETYFLEWLAKKKFPHALIKVVRIGTRVGPALKEAWDDVQAQGGGAIEQSWGVVLGGS